MATKTDRMIKARYNREAEIRSAFHRIVKDRLPLQVARDRMQECLSHKMRQSDFEYLRGCYDGLVDFIRSEFTRFSYLHPDTGVRTDSSELCNAGLASRLDTETGAFAWLIEGKVSDRIYH